MISETKDGVNRLISYDNIDQVKTVTESNTEAYNYDANGNRISGGNVPGVNNQLTTDGIYNYQYNTWNSVSQKASPYLTKASSAVKNIWGNVSQQASNSLNKATSVASDFWRKITQNCFIAGTEIQTLDGTKNIEDIHVGDWVLSDDPYTPGESEYKQVLQTFAHDTTKFVDIYIGGEKITTTEEHPFWVPDVGWVAAKDLHAGTHLQTKTESWLDIDRVELHGGLATVYNFEVAGFHTYFVSDLGLLVHNICGPAAKEIDWTHIYKNHSERGAVALKSKKDIFYGLSDNEIRKTVKSAWKDRKKIETQSNDFTGETRIKYEGIDEKTGYIGNVSINAGKLGGCQKSKNLV